MVGAQAATISGSLWVDASGAADATLAAAVGLGTPTATFTVNNGPLTFNSSGSTYYTIGSWLATGGASIITDTAPGTSMNGTLTELTGQVTLKHGQTFTFTHDDGMTLEIIGPTALTTSTVISSPGPTSAETSSFTWSGASGTYGFELVYGETAGAPAVLEGSLPYGVPDGGSTLALLGGAFTLLGVVSRRARK
jgi:hypothetical protein